jgi:hypothetical protein
MICERRYVVMKSSQHNYQIFTISNCIIKNKIETDLMFNHVVLSNHL